MSHYTEQRLAVGARQLEVDRKIPKVKLAVTLMYAGGADEKAYIFLDEGQRLSDVMNDNRLFLPLQSTKGDELLLRKDHILAVVEGHYEQRKD